MHNLGNSVYLMKNGKLTHKLIITAQLEHLDTKVGLVGVSIRPMNRTLAGDLATLDLSRFHHSLCPVPTLTPGSGRIATKAHRAHSSSSKSAQLVLFMIR